MAADLRGLPRAESERRVAVNVDLGDLARAAELLPPELPVMASGGFTIDELVAHTGRLRPTVNRQVLDLVRAGKYELVGRRPGRNGAKVYKVLD